MNKGKDIIVGIGELLWDILPEGKVLGGAPANFAYHASQFGFDGIAVSAVGDDALGREILDTLQDKQHSYLVETVDYPTGTVEVSLDGNGVPGYDIREGVAWDNIPFTAQMGRLARDCKAVCWGTLAQRSLRSRETIARFLELVPSDALRVFDINLRQHYYTRGVIHESLTKCNIFKINDEEMVEVARLFDLRSLAEEDICTLLLERYDLEMVIETKGSAGSRIFTADKTSFMETPVVEVADTVGAGDSFTGAFVAAILKGAPLVEAHRMAVEVAAFVCTKTGAMPALPQRFTAGENNNYQTIKNNLV